MAQNRSKTTNAAKCRKGEIIDGALQLFSRYGYHSTSLNDVASKIGVTKATLYYYFRSKEEIMRAILVRAMERMDNVLTLDKSSLPPKEKLRKFIQYHITYGSDGADLARITFDQISAFPKRVRNSLMNKEKKIDTLLQAILEQGIQDGSIVVEDIKIASYAILGVCNWIYHWYKPGGRLAPEQISEICIGLLENGYLNKAAAVETDTGTETAAILPLALEKPEETLIKKTPRRKSPTRKKASRKAK